MDAQDSHSADGTLNAARRSLAEGRLADAERLCRSLLSADPKLAEAWFVLGCTALQAGQPGAAREALSRAVGLDAARPDFLAALAQSYSMTWHHPQAAEIAREALALRPKDPLVLNALGRVLLQADQPQLALPVLRQAAQSAPGSAGCQFNLAAASRTLGKLEQARDACEAALAADPDFFRAHSMLAELQRGRVDGSRLADLRSAFAALGPHEVEASLHIGFALARALESEGKFTEALALLAASKAPARRMLAYDFAEDEALFQAVMRMPAPPDPPAADIAAQQSPRPIFVMGMPRSGTTLLERMLSSHPDIGSAGELHNFGILVQRAGGDSGRGVPSPEVLERAAGSDLKKLGKEYLQSVQPRIGDEPCFVDKLPHNYLFAGFIARALPSAPMICMRRNPMDTCLGNFRQLFALGFPYYRYSYDLDDTARYFIAFDRLMDHWQALMPGRILEVEYEALVANPESQLRRVLAHCGREWDPACLAFADNQAPVSTASAVQVREGLNTRAVERWRRYAGGLQDVRERLERAGVEVVAPTEASS